MTNAIAVSYAAGAFMYLLLAVLLLTAWRGRLQGALLVAVAVMSALWCGSAATQAAFAAPDPTIVGILEVLRNGVWLAFLLKLLGVIKGSAGRRILELRVLGWVGAIVCVGLVLLALAVRGSDGVLSAKQTTDVYLFGHVVLAVLGLAFVEQVYRNTVKEHRWAIKLLCFGAGGAFAYDFFLYSDALLFKQIDADLWAARGLVNALVVPLVAVSAARNPQWSLEIFVSRHVVFHTAALVGAGLYLMLMAAAGYYVRIYGGTWGSVLQVVFLFGAVVLLFLLLFSGQIRARAKVFLGKHFFKNKYDYREEWLRFTTTLSASGSDSTLRENVIRAIADIVESPAGLLYMRSASGFFQPSARWNMPVPADASVATDSPLAEFLERTGWVVYLDGFRAEPGSHEGLELPPWIAETERMWLITPLMHSEELLGFVVLCRSSTPASLNWEDSDLLKTVGRQAASYLALLTATEALSDARQFDAFNRLSSYVVHDLKNLVAQLSLVVSNAQKHRNNPEFMDDAINTVANATSKMNRLLNQLRKGRMEETTSELVNLRRILEKVCAARAVDRPPPGLECDDDALVIKADPVRLAAVMEHLVQNAQEATPDEGRVVVRLAREQERITVEVEDSGCGMDHDFVANRLFRPFDTTKGNAGMGIGVYESREFVRGRGGDIDVTSKPGKGTLFRIRFPVEPREPVSEPARHEEETAN